MGSLRVGGGQFPIRPSIRPAKPGPPVFAPLHAGLRRGKETADEAAKAAARYIPAN